MFPSSRLRKAVIASVAVATLALAGCAGGSTSPGGSTGGGTPTPGGNLTVISLGEMTCLDPWQTVIRAALQWQRQLQDSLLFEDRDGAFHPWLAESYEVNADATRFRFVLREGVRFSDGSTLNAETVAENLDALKAEPRYAVAQDFLRNYAGTEVVDDRTVDVSFSQPNAPFLYGISTPNLSLSSTATARLPAGQRCEGQASGSGPFTLESRRAGEQAVLARNADYAWAARPMANQGAAYLDTITVNQVTDQTIIGQAGLAGDAQLVQGFSDSLRPQLEQAGWQSFNEPDPATASNVIFYPGRGVFGGDETARRAFNLALDRSDLVLATGTSTYTEAAGVLNRAHPFHTDQSAQLRRDVPAANALLDGAGWVRGTDGIRVKDGQRLSIETIGNATIADALAVAAQQLAEVGIELRIRVVTFQEEVAARAEGRIEARVNIQTGAEPTVLTLLFDGDLPEGLAALASASAATTDFPERRATVDRMESLLLDQGWLAPLWESINTPWWAPGVNGPVRDVGGLYMMSQIWLTPTG